MTAFATIVTWLALLVLVGIEFVLSRVAVMRGILPFIGIGMAVLVALTFMRLGHSRGLVPVFAVAGVFWLCVMLGLGCLDSLTRHDIFVSPMTDSSELP